MEGEAAAEAVPEGPGAALQPELNTSQGKEVVKDAKSTVEAGVAEEGLGSSSKDAVIGIQGVRVARSSRANSRAGKRSIADFMVGMLMGEGAYARVHVCRLKNSEELYAVKVMEKRFIVKEGKVNFVNMEKKVLSLVDHPLMVKLYFSFHDMRYLYLVMDLCTGGELQKFISFRQQEARTKFGLTNRACSVEESRFYLAETASAMQHLHNLGFIHRDIKPDNVLLTSSGHIKLTDFGTVKDERIFATGRAETRPSSPNTADARRGTFCGTAEYVSPEVLSDADPSVGADLWALGCMLFQLLVGAPPFRGGSEYFTFQMITKHCSEPDAKVHIPEVQKFDREESEGEFTEFSESAEDLELATDLVNALLRPDPRDRLGAGENCTPFNPNFEPNSSNGPKALRAHGFFEGINFETIHEREAPRIPYHFDIPEPTFDGASDEWIMAGDITELELAAALELSSPSSTSSIPRKSSTATREVTSATAAAAAAAVAEVEGLPAPSSSNAQDSSVNSSVFRTTAGELMQFLDPEESIVLDGGVVKRKSLFHTNTRHLILTDRPRFIYVDPKTVVVKGEIPITDEVEIQVKSSKTFDIITPKRVYHMTDVMSQAQRWQDAFNRTVKKKNVS